MPNKANYEEIVNEVNERYIAEVEKVAEQVRQDEIIPFCKQHQLDFISGNGTFFFYKPALENKSDYDGIIDPDYAVDDDFDGVYGEGFSKRLIELTRILYFEVAGNQLLAYYMHDYRRS